MARNNLMKTEERGEAEPAEGVGAEAESDPPET